MTSLGNLIEFVRHTLSGLDADKDAITATSVPLGTEEITLPVEDTTNASIGIAELGFEQVRVRRVNGPDATLTLWPFGRGYRGTKRAAHPVGTEVRFNPSWPAATVAREINGVLLEIYPAIYAVRAHETVLNENTPVDVPAEAVGIISVWVRAATANNDTWVREDRWDFNPDGNTGAGLRVGGLRTPGDEVRVVYAARPGLFDLDGALTQDFTTTTGMDPRISDLLALGVAKRLAPFIDVAKLPFISASAADGGETKSAGTGVSAARFVTSLFLSRLQDEAAVLTREHPIRVHRIR